MPNYYLSEKRLIELKEELQELKTTSRMEVAERLKRAKEFGDLSENTEYSEARDAQETLESRIEEVEDMIKNASIIKKGLKCESVEIGCEVEISSGVKKKTLTIVGSNEARPEDGLVSNESPFGTALLGKSVGEIVTIKTPAGESKWKVDKIK